MEVGSCRLAGGDGTPAKVGVGAPRRGRPRAAAPPKPPKRCPYQRPGPGSRPPLARRAGRRGGDDHRVGPRKEAAAGALGRGRSALRPRRTSLVVISRQSWPRGTCKPPQRSATTDRAPVTSRPAVRVRSSALLLRFAGETHGCGATPVSAPGPTGSEDGRPKTRWIDRWVRSIYGRLPGMRPSL